MPREERFDRVVSNHPARIGFFHSRMSWGCCFLLLFLLESEQKGSSLLRRQCPNILSMISESIGEGRESRQMERASYRKRC